MDLLTERRMEKVQRQKKLPSFLKTLMIGEHSAEQRAIRIVSI
jgi:hypothetical protein